MSPEPVRDGCEWNPDEARPAWNTDEHHRTTPAFFIVGADGQWRLCSSCAALPHFRRFHTRRIIAARTQEQSR